MAPRVAIIYLCYGNLRHLPDVVSALAGLDYPKDRLTVYMVPNGSPDGIADTIRKDVLPRSGKDLPTVVLLDDGKNRGFAGGNNLAMRQALDAGHDFVFLHNGDLKLHPSAIQESVKTAERDKDIASVQSLVLYWKNPEIVNTSGGMVHIAGYGYGRDNLANISDVFYDDVEEIAYASGAAVLYRADVLKRVGLLEEGFFMYHEDLELGLRMRIGGYKNMLASGSIAYHDYQFSRNPKKFAWTELYRWVVMLAYYKPLTLIALWPMLMAVEAGTWALSIPGGWFGAKLWAYGQALRPSTWKLVLRMRRRTAHLREVPDRELLAHVTGKIEAQEESNTLVERAVNPILARYVRYIQRFIVW